MALNFSNKLLFVIILYFIFSGKQLLIGGEIKYPVNTIPDSLKKSANAVIRNSEMTFDLKSIEKAELRLSWAITILNKSALQKSYFAKPYDQFSKVKNIKGAVYDASGELVKKIKPDDIHDISASGGGSLFVDNRAKIIDPEYLKFPFTVEYSCEIEYDGLLNYPNWIIYSDYQVSVERSVFSLKRPGHINVRKLFRGIDKEPSESVVNGEHVLTWEVLNKKALKKEPLSDELMKISPAIILAPSDFIIDGYEGNCETWENFGNWIYTLNDGKRELPDDTKQKIKDLIEGADSEYETAKILYQYLQDKTRYVSVQIGIGGWQPIEAEQVDELSYGDCKALTNYMQALLDVAGIDSYYTLVRAGREASEINSQFPMNQFNHAILGATIEDDTVWMECTSQRLPFGYIGSFTDDRDVVLINENGGNLVHTQAYTASDNQKICSANIEVDNFGNAVAEIVTDYKGVYYDKMLSVLLSDDEDRKQQIRQEIHIPNFILNEFDLVENRGEIPSVKQNIHLTIDGCGTKFGSRLAINLNMTNKIGKIPSKNENRLSDIVVRRSVVEIDTIVYSLPEGFKVEKISKDREVINMFGSLKTKVNVNGSEIHYLRQLTLNKGTYPPESYGAFYEFYNIIKKADDDRMILTKANLTSN